MDVPALRDADPVELYTSADAYDRLADEFTAHARSWQDTVHARVRDSGWTGGAAERAEDALSATTARLGAARTELDLVGPVLREGAEAFLLAQSQLRQALTEAAAHGCTVADDGSVSWPPPPAADRHDPDAALLTAAGGDLRRRIALALADADRADRAVADRLRRFADLTRTGPTPALAAAERARSAAAHVLGADQPLTLGMPAPGTPPAQAAAWWRALTDAGRERLLDRHPELLGNLDGLPAAVRDTANRRTLPRLIARLGGTLPRTPREQDLLDGFRRIQDRLRAEDAADGGPVLLLALAEEGQGRAALSFGDPDTADDVAVYVPGLGTRLGDVGGKDGDRAKTLLAAARAADPARSTASITWLGYDAPQLESAGPDALAVAGTARAEQGGAGYQRFLRGLRAGRAGAPAHLTALGHSYGSLTVGRAAQRPGGLPADEIVLVGSPGTGAQRAADLRADPDHVWVGAAEHDPVTRLPGRAAVGRAGLGAGAGLLLVSPAAVAAGAAAARSVAAADPGELWFGQDPASREFGARRFAVEDGDWQHAHSDYWGRDSGGSGGSSLESLGAIVAGHGERVPRQSPR
jgi:hypothetical protein